MKRIGNLYHLIYDIENIKLAHENARKGKAHYKEVKLVDSDVDYYCNLIHEMLVNKTFVNSPYEVFTKVDSCINGKFTLLALELGLNNKLLRGSRYES